MCCTTNRANNALRFAWAEAAKIADDDVAVCHSIGEHGFKILKEAAAKKNGETLNVPHPL